MRAQAIAVRAAQDFVMLRPMAIVYCPSLESIGTDLDALDAEGDPFLDPRFLLAAERHGAAAPRTGWQPCHATLRGAADELLGVMPLYARTDSYGDFAWDFGWASAWRQTGLSFYPKLVTGIPCTPSIGPRFLLHPTADRAAAVSALIRAAVDLARANGFSVWQCLFPRERDLPFLADAGLLLREGVQYHWRNADWHDFDDFLHALSSKRRKEIRRERRRATASGLDIGTFHGDEIADDWWPAIHRHYRSTFERLGGYPNFSEGFFREIGAALGRRMVIVLAFDGVRPVASAICYRDEHTLYGRHWGADAEVDCLHFELCYYRGIDYCLEHGLQSFEPGAGGEHKIARGFLPAKTYSAHWVTDPRLRRAVADFIARERRALEDYAEETVEGGPFVRRE